MNPDLEKLFPYPFTRLDDLTAGLKQPASLPFINLSIGEPRHAAPEFVLDALTRASRDLGSYPQSAGLPIFRSACANWLERRFGIGDEIIDPESMVLPLSGTREGLFAFAQAVIDRDRNATVLMPNPFYQIYEGAALLAGAQPVYLNALPENDFLPDLDAVSVEAWERCQLLYVCTPGNPTGAVMDLNYLRRILELSDRYDFVIASDECYSEIYFDEDKPPPSLLQACLLEGRDQLQNCAVFHSLSKRSSVPGLRSGFVAGDAEIIRRFRLYRSYHGCAMPVHHQLASVAAWNDDAHVAINRSLYREKFATAGNRVCEALDYAMPTAAFYLWAAVPVDDELFASRLYSEQNVLVLPGSYLARNTADGNPGKGRVRISLVAARGECNEAAGRIVSMLSSL
ncbi:MAG: succinyldiaminopimelate transaminase [Gammaproteobacteria bacterium]|nr:succinyldiaminopimelate transaminase [Gammaproteobacteria bacterium]